MVVSIKMLMIITDIMKYGCQNHNNIDIISLYLSLYLASHKEYCNFF